ncbi:hypothetical protein R8510_04746 [Ralstonia chuxiongensis]|nr:hypothetical protein R8510_04746 [Ralstonia chuxiongensis]
MTEWTRELAERLVVGRKRDGRGIYDPQAKRELVEACRQPGISVARIARECGVNANLLSDWIRRHEREQATGDTVVEIGTPMPDEPAAFIPVQVQNRATPEPERLLTVQVRLPNGVMVELRDCEARQLPTLFKMLGEMRCSASTKG